MKLVLVCSLMASCGFTALAEEVPVKVVDNKDAKKEDKQGGNWFTNFWVHKVGGTIGNGLKKGAHKIDRGFNNTFGKDNDEPKKDAKVEAPKVEVKQETKTETKPAEPVPLPKP